MLKIVSATAMTIFSLATVFAATIAWFSTNTETASDGMGLNVSYASGRLSYIELHQLNSIAYNRDIPTYKFATLPYCTLTYNWAAGDFAVEGNNNIFQLGQYTLLDQEHPVLMIFALDRQYTSETNGDIYIKGLTDVGGFLGDVVNDLPKYDLGDPTEEIFVKRVVDGDVTTDYYALSSVVKFSYKTYTTSAYNTFTQDATTLDFVSNDASLKKGQSFVHFEDEDSTPIYTQQPTIYSSTAGEQLQYIAVIMNYYPDALNAIFTTYLRDTVLDDTYDGYLNFACDWTLEIA